MGTAVGTESAQRDVVLGDQESGGELPTLVLTGLGELDIGDVTALRAVEVAMLPEVRAESGRLPVDMDGLHQTIAHHRLQAVVDRGQRDRGHPLLGTDKYLRRRGVIPLGHQHLVNLTALRGEPQTTLHHGGCIGPHRALAGRNGGVFLHRVEGKRTTRKHSIKNYSKLGPPAPRLLAV